MEGGGGLQVLLALLDERTDPIGLGAPEARRAHARHYVVATGLGQRHGGDRDPPRRALIEH